MKAGTFFQIPETPGDVDVLRSSAAPLDKSTLPKWLDHGDRDYYRYLGRTSTAGPVQDNPLVLRTEIEELESAGLVVVEDPNDFNVRHVYIPSVADYDVWAIGIYTGCSLGDLHPAPEVKNPVLSRDDVHDVPAVFVADPFVVEQDNNWFMFFEVLNWRANKGEIGLATSTDGLQWQYEQRVLVELFHLSYPYVFEHDGQHYMIPEARQSGAVRLYRAVEFPVRWSFVTTLIKSDSLVDTSLFLNDGRWWLLAGHTAGVNHDTLRLYFAEALTGPWFEHPASPIVTGNPHAARPAGRIVVADSRVYRFAQNCRPHYGTDVRAFEIMELTTTTYREIAVGTNPVLGPSGLGWNAFGMHHIDAHRLANGAWLAYVDGWMRVT